MFEGRDAQSLLFDRAASAPKTLARTLRYFTPGRLCFWFFVFGGLVLAFGALVAFGDEAREYRLLARFWKANLAGFAGLFVGRLVFDLGVARRAAWRTAASLAGAVAASALTAAFSQWFALFANLPSLGLGATSPWSAAPGSGAVAFVLSILILPLWLREEAGTEPEPRLHFRERRRSFTVSLNEIVYVEARGKRCVLHTESAQYILSETLARVETRVPAGDFVRVHKSYLVRAACIGALHSGRNGARLRLRGDHDEELPVGRTFANALRLRLGDAPRR